MTHPSPHRRSTTARRLTVATAPQWFVAATAHEVGRKPLARTIADKPVVLFRRRDGSIAALADRCPHYGLPLSSGDVIGDDIECGFHGLRFDGSGVCTYMPTQKLPPERFCVHAYPVDECDGQVLVAITPEVDEKVAEAEPLVRRSKETDREAP